MIKSLSGYDPGSKQETLVSFGSEKEALKRAKAALAELRGETAMRQTKNGSFVADKSGCDIKPARNINAVPIINRTNGEVRWINFDGSDAQNNYGAACDNQMRMMFDGIWRFATEDEEKAAIAKNEAERAAINRERAKEKPGVQAELIGQEIGRHLAEVVKAKK